MANGGAVLHEALGPVCAKREGAGDPENRLARKHGGALYAKYLCNTHDHPSLLKSTLVCV